jgi:hypothetical protein
VSPSRTTACAILVLLFFLPLTASAQLAPSKVAQPASPLEAQNGELPYEPITGRQRLYWFVEGTLGPEHVALGLASAAVDTALDDPPEYRGTWSGFGKRFGVREAAASLSHAMKIRATSGARTQRSCGGWGTSSSKHSSRSKTTEASSLLTLDTQEPPGAASSQTPGRARSEADSQEALLRIGYGSLTRMASNAFDEFWPDAKQHLFHRH